MDSQISIEVSETDLDSSKLLEQMAEKYGWSKSGLASGGVTVFFEDGALKARLNENKKMKPLCVDFVGGKLGYRREHASVGKNSVLAKAIGVRHEPNFVLDATLGFASDTFNFLSMGLSVVGIESSPLVYELVRDGVRRAKEDSELVSWFHHLEILLGRAEDLMNHWEKERPDVIYLDPMFPEKKKSSLSGREMQFLQWLLKDQEMDEGKLLSSARELARERVVVKRPAWAKPIMEDVSHQFAGSSIRYDMYLVKREV